MNNSSDMRPLSRVGDDGPGGENEERHEQHGGWWGEGFSLF